MIPISKILVPVDFSAASLHALDEAIDLAATLRASVVLMHVYELPPVPLFPEVPLASPASVAESLAASSDGALRGIAESRGDRGVQIDTVVREGVPWQQIDEAADEVSADLIVLGTHGRRGILRALLGSVAEKVVRTAHQPVLTIPTPDDASASGGAGGAS